MKRKAVKKSAPDDHSNKVIIDGENPEWTKADFARAKYGDDMPDAIKRAFMVRGRPAKGS